MLSTRLPHVDTDEAFRTVLAEHENVMICCGRMGPMCVPVYAAMEALRDTYPHVAFRDMWFDGPAAHNIRSLPETQGFMGLPFTVYFKNGKVVAATTSVQTEAQIREILDRVFGAPASTAA